MRRRALLGGACLALALRGPGAAAADEVSVFAAASLADALAELGAAFEARSGHRLAFNFGGSNDLARQIRAGAPADVFFSADEAQMDVVERAGRVRPADRVSLLSNTLVVVVPASSGAGLRGPRDLVRVRRLALGDPEAVPAGVYARAWLEAAGLWESLAGKLVPTLNVRAALAAVESGNVDAAVVYRTDAVLTRRARVAFEVAREHGPKIIYAVAPLIGSPPAARDFVTSLRSAEAARIFEKHGFLVLRSEP